MQASRRWRDWIAPEKTQENLISELPKLSEPSSVSSVSPVLGYSQTVAQFERALSPLHEIFDPYAALPPSPEQDPAEWREPLDRWIASQCVCHWRLHGNVGGLHVAFSEWEVEQHEPPCSRTVFERLLLENGWKMNPTLALVYGLSLRTYVCGDENLSKLLSR